MSSVLYHRPKGDKYIFSFERPFFWQDDSYDILTELERFLEKNLSLLTDAKAKGAKMFFILKNLSNSPDNETYVHYPSELIKALSDLDTTIITYVGKD